MNLKIKETLAKIIGVFTGTEDISMNSGEPGIRACRDDTDTRVGFIVGIGGTNHGVYSYKLNRWMVYSDGTYTWFDSNGDGHYRWDMTTNNTTDTWVPVLSNGKLQHRTIPRNLIYDFSVQSGNTSGNISANGILALDVNVSTIVSGYTAYLMHFDTNSYDIVPIRADLHGTTLTLYFKNLASAQKSFQTYYWIMRYKTAV